MKRITIWLILSVLCLIGASALADGLVPADEKRVDPGLPEGMKYHSLTWSGDVLNIVIDTDATDWDTVATAARKSNSLVIFPGIFHPEKNDPRLSGNEKDRWKNQLGEVRKSDYTRETNKAALYAMLNEGLTENSVWGKNGILYSCGTQGWSIGTFDASVGLFLPQEITLQDGAGFAVCWRRMDGTTCTEYVNFTVSFTKTPPVYVRRQGAGESEEKAKRDIKGNAGDGNSSTLEHSLIKDIEIGEGRIVYKLNNEAAGKTVYTAVAVPSLVNGSNIKAFQLKNGKEVELNICAPGTHFSGRSSIALKYDLRAQNCLYKEDWAIKWVWEDAKGNEKTAVRYLEAEFHVGDRKFTAVYMDFDGQVQDETKKGPKPVPLPAGNLAWTIHNPLDGLSASYQEESGEFRLLIDQDKLPANRKTDLSRTAVGYKVIVPAGAQKCNVYMYKGDVIYGDNGGLAWPIHDLSNLSVEGGQELVMREFAGRAFFREHPVTLHNGKRMCYYVAPMVVGEYGGEALVFEWIMQDGSKVRHFIALTSDAYQLSVRRNPSETKDIWDTVEYPKVKAGNDLWLETAELPQMGDNVIRYEIDLTDKDGNKVQPEEPVLLYLPYPDDMSMEEAAGHVFVVYHELEDGSYEEYSVQKGNLTLTPYGLCMEVTSFSPYFLNWEEAPNASGLPETGDRTSIAGYVLMLALCGACAAMLKKKRVAAEK